MVGAICAQEQESQAEEKRTLEPADYGKWESLGFGTSLSPDGEWLAVPIRRVDGTRELRIHELSNPADPIIVSEGQRSKFSGGGVFVQPIDQLISANFSGSKTLHDLYFFFLVRVYIVPI